MKLSRPSSILVPLILFQTTFGQQSSFTSYQDYAWYQQTLRCQDGLDCTVNCYAASACYYVTIIGPKDAKLTVNCDDCFSACSGYGSACGFSDIYAENSTELHINVYNAPREFWRTSIYTPIPSDPQSTTSNTFITCGIIGPNNPTTPQSRVCSRSNHIYSVDGWETVEWAYYGDSTWALEVDSAEPSVMHCGADYLQSCTAFEVEGYFYECSDNSSACNFGQTSETNPPTKATFDPTSNPTLQPTVWTDSAFTSYEGYAWYQQTLRCQDGLDCTINCYAASACYYVSIIGPKDAKLTVNCDDCFSACSGYGSACGFSDIYAENSTELHINVYNAPRELWRTSIYTPISTDPESPTAKNTFITCGIIGANNPTTPQSRVCSRSNHIYSVHGWETVEWTYSESSTWALEVDSAEPSFMHCGTDYLQSCSGFEVDGFYYTCSDKLSACYFNQTSRSGVMTTSSPTVSTAYTPAPVTESPATIWSTEDLIMSSMFPTGVPTPEPTENPIDDILSDDGQPLNASLWSSVAVSVFLILTFA